MPRGPATCVVSCREPKSQVCMGQWGVAEALACHHFTVLLEGGVQWTDAVQWLKHLWQLNSSQANHHHRTATKRGPGPSM
jgi:hypothetical protein